MYSNDGRQWFVDGNYTDAVVLADRCFQIGKYGYKQIKIDRYGDVDVEI